MRITTTTSFMAVGEPISVVPNNFAATEKVNIYKQEFCTLQDIIP